MMLSKRPTLTGKINLFNSHGGTHRFPIAGGGVFPPCRHTKEDVMNMTIEWFLNNGYELCEPSIEIFWAVYGLTNGQPCHGCNCKDTCRAFKLINHPTAKAHPTVMVETNAEVAKRLGISKRQAAKVRRD